MSRPEPEYVCCNHYRNISMRGANSGTGTAYLTVAPTFTLVIFRVGGGGFVAQSLVFCVLFCSPFFSFCLFSIGHCIVCFYYIDHCIFCLFSIDHCIVCLFSIDHFWCKDNSCYIIIVMFQENLLGGND